MKKSRYTEEQIIGILKQHEAGVKTADLGREHGISAATFYGWKSKFGGMDVSEAARLRQMEDENRRLKQLVADLSLDKEMLKAVIRKNGWRLRGAGLGWGSIGFTLRGEAGPHRGAARGVGEAGAAEAAIRLSAAARDPRAARAGG